MPVSTLSPRSARHIAGNAGVLQQHQVGPQSVKKCEIKHMANDPGPLALLQNSKLLFGFVFFFPPRPLFSTLSCFRQGCGNGEESQLDEIV